MDGRRGRKVQSCSEAKQLLERSRASHWYKDLSISLQPLQLDADEGEEESWVNQSKAEDEIELYALEKIVCSAKSIKELELVITKRRTKRIESAS